MERACLARAELPASNGIGSSRSLARLGDELSFGAGFVLQVGELFGPVREAFGHPGAGGTNDGAWPQERVGFSYGMNEMRDDPAGDDRSASLLDALHRSVLAVGGG